MEDLKWLDCILEQRYAIKTTTIGEYDIFAKEVTILNRIVRWHPGEGATIEADPRHVEIAIKDAGASGSKTLSSTGEKSESKIDVNDQDDSEGELLESARASAYTSVVARMNYLNIDRPHIAFAVKELAPGR